MMVTEHARGNSWLAWPAGFVGAIAYLAVACGGPPAKTAATSAAAPEAPSDVERYLPLEDGTVYSYDTQSEGNPTHGVLIVQISRPRKGRVDLRMGSRTERFELEPGGVADLEGGYLLKAPLRVGATWKGKAGTVRITAMDEKVKVPAGEFEGCIRTLEEMLLTEISRRVTSVYCPHVGLVIVDAEASTQDGHQRETATLKSFGPRVDITTKDVTTTTDD
jgi:hypothetical protein